MTVHNITGRLGLLCLIVLSPLVMGGRPVYHALSLQELISRSDLIAVVRKGVPFEVKKAGNRSGCPTPSGALNRQGAKVAKDFLLAPLARVARGAAPPASRYWYDGRFLHRAVRRAGEAAVPAAPAAAADREALASLAPWRFEGVLPPVRRA